MTEKNKALTWKRITHVLVLLKSFFCTDLEDDLQVSDGREMRAYEYISADVSTANT